MSQERAKAAWLVALVIFAGLALLVLVAHLDADDPLSGGMTYFTLWALVIVTAICTVGFVATAREKGEHKPVEKPE